MGEAIDNRFIYLIYRGFHEKDIFAVRVFYFAMEVDRIEKSVEQSANAILNPSARSENTFFVNFPVCLSG